MVEGEEAGEDLLVGDSEGQGIGPAVGGEDGGVEGTVSVGYELRAFFGLGRVEFFP